ncbi:GerMN domain-containing protein [Micromonospora sp. NPDC000089]|uniref:GerMN domain-containing protein n=1 Tax=unclassified Micromonospora TaxID=2617518 RepID=UPI0036A3A27B
MIRRRLLAALAVLVLLPAGCGVPVDDEPRAVSAPPGPFPTPAGGAGTPSAGRVREVLYFVRDDRLTPVVRWVDATPTVDAHLQQLLAGPSAQERDAGLTNALPGAMTVAVAGLSGTRATVDVREAGQEVGRSDGVYAFGQIVRTLVARDDVDSVAFVRRGRPLGVPRADGSLSTQPLTADDYATLAAPG